MCESDHSVCREKMGKLSHNSFLCCVRCIQHVYIVFDKGEPKWQYQIHNSAWHIASNASDSFLHWPWNWRNWPAQAILQSSHVQCWQSKEQMMHPGNPEWLWWKWCVSGHPHLAHVNTHLETSKKWHHRSASMIEGQSSNIVSIFQVRQLNTHSRGY